MTRKIFKIFRLIPSPLRLALKRFYKFIRKKKHEINHIEPVLVSKINHIEPVEVSKWYLKNVYPYVGHCPKRYQGIYDLMRRQEISTEKMLEVGCLDGYGLKYLSQYGVEGVGVDIYSRALAKDKRETNSLVKASAESLPFKPKSFDVCISTGVLEHIHKAQIEQVLLEMDRVAERNVHGICMDGYEDSWEASNEPWHVNVRGKEYWRGLLTRLNLRGWVLYPQNSGLLPSDFLNPRSEHLVMVDGKYGK